MQFLIKVIILFLACGLAMVLLVRLQRMQQRLAELHEDLRRNDENMGRHRREVERLASAQEAQNQSLQALLGEGVDKAPGTNSGASSANGTSPHGKGEIKLEGPGAP